MMADDSALPLRFQHLTGEQLSGLTSGSSNDASLAPDLLGGVGSEACPGCGWSVARSGDTGYPTGHLGMDLKTHMYWCVYMRGGHVHLKSGCTGDLRDCPDDHWEGGRPQPDQAVLMLHDIATGLTYFVTVLPEEIAEREAGAAAAAAQTDADQAERDALLSVLRQEAVTSPAFAALLTYLGIPPE